MSVAITHERRVTRRGREQARDARLPLGRMFAVAGMQVVVAAARVRVDEQQALVLARQRAQDFEQQDVLVDVGEIAGVILMAVLHETPAPARCAFIHCSARSGSMSKSLKILILAGPLAASAGAADATPTPRRIAPPTRIPDIETLTPLPAGEPVSTAQIPRAVRRAVVADAAKRFKVAESAVVLARAEQLTWSDGSLGCPEPGRMYTQMLVAGFRVVATTSAGELTYHTDSRGNAVNCQRAGRAAGSRALAAGSLNGSASIGSPAADWLGRHFAPRHLEQVMRFTVRGVPQEVADEVRRTRLSPGYGHPVHLEVARGTGPCRCCLEPFVAGRDQRLLFTFRPRSEDGSLMAPGPVFIHAGHCEAFAGAGFPTRCARCRSPSKRASQAVA